MRRFVTILAALALAVFAIGLALVPLTLPAATRFAAARFSLADEAGLPRERMLALAENVRAYVTGSASAREALPATVDGRDGFDGTAVSHLTDVRGVLQGAGLVTGLLAALVTLWMTVAVARRRVADIGAALRIAAIVDAVAVALLAVIALTSFDAFFSAFHGLFFAAGTWTFPSDSLLIQLFPEPFWVSAGAAWAVIVVAIAGVYALAGRAMSAERPGR